MNHSRRSDQHPHYNHPSFSSSLLEEIYRSFDDDHHSHRYSTKTNHTNNTSTNSTTGKNFERPKDDDRFRVNRFDLDQWMENNNQKINRRRNSMAANHNHTKFNYSSSTSSSDSSSGICGFSGSDTESLYGSSKSKNPSLKPIKTTLNQPEFHRKSYSDDFPPKSKSKEGNLQKRALKLYGDLKKVKQPISPGGKLASFLNSLFNSNSSSKKPKISSSSSKSTSSNGAKFSTSTPSTASSYSRSCLSKTPSSAGRFERRSVRFCPVSTVMAYSDDKEDVREKASRNEDLKVQIMDKHRRVEEVAKELLKNYHHGRKYQNDVNHKKNNNNNIRGFEVEDEDDDDDDDVSCCSSDLFELDHLLEVGGNQRYCEELPVYETTHVDTNRAIANGFIL
ncbi:Protein BIG GRAIN 1-like B [Bienertia sinuspersici]